MYKLLFTSALIFIFSSTMFKSIIAQTDEIPIKKEEKIQMPKSFPKMTDDNHEKYDKEKKEWIKKHPEEYRKMGGNPNPPSNIKPKEEIPVNPVIEQDNEDEEIYEIPKNGIFWKFEKALASSTKTSINKLDIQLAQNNMNNDLIKKNLMIIMNDSEFLMISNEVRILLDYTIENHNLILTTPNEEQSDGLTFKIIEQTPLSLIFCTPYEKNEEISIELHFTKVKQP